VRSLKYPNLEFIISDRHLADDALDRLEQRFGCDSRFRFLRRPDRADWIDHYNDLIREAKGDYFLWMPHDDSYPEDYVSKLVEALEADRRAVIAFGRVEAIDLNGRPMSKAELPEPPIHPEGSWTTRDVIRLDMLWNAAIAIRGLIRRQPVVDRGLFIRRTRNTVLADKCWVFGLGLLGRWIYLPDCRCMKRYYPTSTHAAWQGARQHTLRQYFVQCGYLWDYAPRRLEALEGMLALGLRQIARELRKRGNTSQGGVRAAGRLDRFLVAAARRMVGAGASANPKPPGRHGLEFDAERALEGEAGDQGKNEKADDPVERHTEEGDRQRRVAHAGGAKG
jgi:hypothetical protein